MMMRLLALLMPMLLLRRRVPMVMQRRLMLPEYLKGGKAGGLKAGVGRCT